jgi:glycosyltransferase 2 family protein
MKSGRRGASLVSVLVTGALLAGLYLSLDVRLIGEALLKADPLWLVISIGMILPITLLRAIRFLWVAPPGALPGVGEALRLTFVASALNVFVPAKAGDLVKSYFVARRSDTSAGVAVAIVVYERLCDLFALFLWSVLGWVIGRPRVPGIPPIFWVVLAALGGVCAVLILSERVAAASQNLVMRTLPHGRFRRLHDFAGGWPELLRTLRGRRRWIVPFSLFLWLTHLFQMWLFTVALVLPMPFSVCASLSALALMAGQLPFTVAGIGARDLALVVLLSGYMAPESAAAMGVLVTTRNVLPPLVGIPMMGPYISSVLGEARRWRQRMEQAE